jgi:hypothetical protein
MPSLLEAQRAFARQLEFPDGDGMRAYRANVAGNQAAALGGAYPVVRKIVGEPFFDALAFAYAQAYPSTCGDLNRYGALLAQFVASFPQTLDLPYLPDVARMEWLVHRAYYAADPPAFDASALAGTDPARWKLRLAAPCALMASAWPVASIWAAHQDGASRPEDIALSARGERVLVCRPRWRGEARALPAGEFGFLRAIEDGARLGEALEAAAADRAFDAATVPAHYVQLGVLTI